MVLVDTSIWIQSTNQKDGLEANELDALLARDEVATTEIVIAEVLQGTMTERDFAQYSDKMEALRCLPATKDTWVKAAELSFRLRRRGLTTPLTDLVVATVAIENEIAVYAKDQHFERIPGLKLHEPESSNR